MRALLGAAVLALPLGLGTVVGLGAAVPGPAQADTAPAAGVPATVSADALPTVQVDGVVWSQVVVGNVVYAGGKFTTARPAGAAAGTSTVARNNLLAYDIRTGALVSSFAPNLNGQVLGLAASPDGSRVYVAGEFTLANGAKRYRVAAYSTSTGALVSSFAPTLDFRARSVLVSPDGATVYVGGAFTSANGNPRTGLAAFRAADGALLGWAPKAEGGQVWSMVLSPDRSRLVVGGQFSTLSGTAAYGMGALDPATGGVLPWAANTVVKNAGANGAITSLSVDAGKVYGTGYDFGTGANFEGAFAADPATGRLVWLQDCHGDTYSSAPVGGALYTVGHAHFCGNVGAFPETSPRSFQRALAFSTSATGRVQKNTEPGYTDFAGQPAPSLLTWWPQLDAGTATGQNQAAWSVTGTSDYVVLAGEFPRVNGVAQQGLVRFAVRSLAPNASGPVVKGAPLNPALTSFEAGTIRVSWPADWDRDNELLTYQVYRDGDLSTPVFTTTARSTFWYRPPLGFTDRGLAPGSAHRYRLFVTDPTGLRVSSDTVTGTAGTSGTVDSYGAAVLADGASTWWRLGEASGATAYDRVGVADGVVGTGVTRGVPGALAGVPDTASRFDGSPAGLVVSPVREAAPDRFTVEAWVRTTSTTGGKLFGFGNRNTGTSTVYDRHVYMDASGRLLFGVHPRPLKTVASTASYNDGAWHHVAATLGSDGMALYVDGALVASDSTVTRGEPFTGWWRVGGDTVAAWPSAPANGYLAGDVDEVAIYPTALTAAQLADHVAKARESAPNAAPTAAFTASTSDLSAAFDASGSADADGAVASYAWDFGDGSTGTGVAPRRTYAAAGTYTVRLTVTDDAGARGTTTRAVTVTAPPSATEAGAVLAADTFTRSTTGGWGTADTGGAWTVTGGASSASVTGGTGRLAMAAPAAGATAHLNGVSSAGTDLRVRVQLDKPATGGGTYLSAVGRRVGTTGDYRLRLRSTVGDGLTASLVRVQGSTETALQTVTLPGTYPAGTPLAVRLQVTGTAPTTLAGKVWRAAEAEPAAALLSATDATAALQAPGAVGFVSYLSGSATNAPVVASLDDLRVTTSG